MSAAAALSAVRQAGAVVRLDGADLVVRGPSEMPESIVRDLARHRAEVIELLGKRRPPFNAEEWLALFHERAAILEFDGGLTRSDAEARALEHCLAEWLNQHPASSRAGHCAWCSQPEAAGAAVVPFGIGDHHTWLHPQCWPAWHGRRRADALAALRRLGLPVSEMACEPLGAARGAPEAGDGR
jgi:hypothetical protein